MKPTVTENEPPPKDEYITVAPSLLEDHIKGPGGMILTRAELVAMPQDEVDRLRRSIIEDLAAWPTLHTLPAAPIEDGIRALGSCGCMTMADCDDRVGCGYALIGS